MYVHVLLLCTTLFCRPNEEKIVYFLLLSHKERQPSLEDETKVPGATEKGIIVARRVAQLFIIFLFL